LNGSLFGSAGLSGGGKKEKRGLRSEPSRGGRRGPSRGKCTLFKPVKRKKGGEINTTLSR